MNVRSLCVGCVIVATSLSVGGSARGGSLAPPAGPIQPTSRTVLSQATTPMPITITQPGSYVLTSNLTGSPGNGIEISVDGVTIDLNGFVVDGAGSVGSGIALAAIVHDVTVKNGFVRGWGNTGVQLSVGLPGPTGLVIEGVSAQDCGRGFEIYEGSMSRCSASQSQFDGVTAVRSILKDCTSHDNGLGGAGSGFVLFEGSKISDSAAMENSDQGFFLGITSEAEGCTAKLNNGNGFNADGAGTIRACISASNGGDGFELFGAQAIQCAAETNAGNGFVADQGAGVRDSKALGNGLSGIHAMTETLIDANQCVRNALYGIQTSGTNARVSNNACQHNTFDNFYLDGSVNSIYSNSATLSLAGVNYNFVTPLNDVAPVSSASAMVSPVGNVSY